MKVCLSIAGSDPSSGAGVQQDLKTFTHFGIYGVCVITAITAQNTKGVEVVYTSPPGIVEDQLESLLSDIKVNAVKTGMLCNSEVVKVISEELRKFKIPNLIVDPVMVSKNGKRLLTDDGVEMLRKELLKLTTLITPNILEASILSEVNIKSLKDMERAAVEIYKSGPKYVLIKGGHLKGKPIDILYNGRDFKEFRGERINKEVHGIGCALSSAITASLALGMDIEQAIKKSKDYITKAIAESISLGQGYNLISLE